MNEPNQVLIFIYRRLLRLYPGSFQQEFGEEMHTIFVEAATEAAAQEAVGPFFLRELRDIPPSLVQAYWYSWTKKWQKGIKRIRNASTTTDLPPPSPDGRQAWRQVGLELSLFLVIGSLLILVTYRPFTGLPAGWQRDLGFLGQIITPLTLPFFLIGLVRGLPRWAYPFGGLLLSYQALAANQARLWPFLTATLLLSLILGAAAILTDPHPSLLPVSLRRLRQSLALDWTRLSFGIYGALPLAIMAAFDDAFVNNQTPYLACAVLAMVAGALFYSRSRQSAWQIAALLGGMTLSIGAAWLDKAAFAGGLRDGLAVPSPGTAELAWMVQLWSVYAFLILFPPLLALFSSTVRLNRIGDPL
jgi:hypothetical protein